MERDKTYPWRQGCNYFWKDSARAFNAQVFPKSCQAKMREYFVHISQGDPTVMEYAGYFNQLSRFA